MYVSEVMLNLENVLFYLYILYFILLFFSAFRCAYCFYWNPARKQRPFAPRLETITPQLPPPTPATEDQDEDEEEEDEEEQEEQESSSGEDEEDEEEEGGVEDEGWSLCIYITRAFSSG